MSKDNCQAEVMSNSEKSSLATIEEVISKYVSQSVSQMVS